MPAISIAAFAICDPGDLDGPRPILYFTDRGVAEVVLREMNSAGVGGPYTLRPITVWSGTPKQTPLYRKQAWLNGRTGEWLDAARAPSLKVDMLWPWHLESASIGATAGPVPVGIYISVTDFDRTAVEREFDRLVARERAKIKESNR